MTSPAKPRRKSGPSGPRSRLCPRCGAGVGEICRTPSGASSGVSHVERREGRPRKSGEGPRAAGQVLLRLDAATQSALRELSERWGTTRSATVARSLRAALDGDTEGA